MTNPIEQSRTKCSQLLFLGLLVLLVSGCSAGLKIAPDLLAHAENNNSPLINNSVAIDAEINPAINNHERIDESVKESLELALQNANIFGADSARPYRIHANVTIASQPAWSFGNFNGKLEVIYTLFDEAKNTIMEETVYTEAGSDKKHFSGAKRHRRARAVNISKNVLQFVDILQSKFGK